MARGPKKMSDDQRLQNWLEWYDRNQARSEYRRRRYELMTEEKRQEDRERRRRIYKQRIAEGWAKPNRQKRTDVLRARAIAINLLIQRDGRHCGLCGKDIDDDSQLSIDHIVPLSMGGSDDATNIRLAHLICNTRRPRKPKDLRIALEANGVSRLIH